MKLPLVLRTPKLQRCMTDVLALVNSNTFWNTVNFLKERWMKVTHLCLPILADKCDDSFVHRDCISCCPPTCTFEKQCLGSNLRCLDGCYCPDGKCCIKGTMSAFMQTSVLWSEIQVITFSPKTSGLLWFPTLVGFVSWSDQKEWLLFFNKRLITLQSSQEYWNLESWSCPWHIFCSLRILKDI